MTSGVTGPTIRCAVTTLSMSVSPTGMIMSLKKWKSSLKKKVNILRADLAKTFLGYIIIFVVSFL